MANPNIAGLLDSWVQGSIAGVRGASVGPVGAPGVLFGNIVTGITGSFVGYGVNPAFGSTSDPNPNPPGGGTALFNIGQDAALGWTISFSTAQVLQNAWTSVTLENNIDTPIVLLSAAATYVGFVFTTPLSSRWTFGATADLWNKLGAGAGVSAIFA